MDKERELSFSIYILYSLADSWKKSPAAVYRILKTTGILDNYIMMWVSEVFISDDFDINRVL